MSFYKEVTEVIMTDSEKKIEFQRVCEEYIEEQSLYEIFEDMMRSLIINKPDDPVKFLIDKLEKPESKLHFVSCLLRKGAIFESLN